MSNDITMTPEQNQSYRLKLEESNNLQVGDILQCNYPWPRPINSSNRLFPAGTKFLIKDIQVRLGNKHLHLVPHQGIITEEFWISIDTYLVADFLTLCHAN